LTDGDMPLQIQGPARSWLLHRALTPNVRSATPAEAAASNWLVEHSLALTDLKAKHVEATLVAMGRRLDGGGAVVSTTLSRRRNALNHCLKLAERDELLVRNPLSAIDKSALPPVKTVDPAAIPDLLQGHALIDYIDGEVTAPGGHGDYIRAVRHRYATFLRVMLLSGMRPSEASNLNVFPPLPALDGLGHSKGLGRHCGAGGSMDRHRLPVRRRRTKMA
jgi:hypothetical protein